MVEINGVAHTILTVSNYEKCAPFYTKMCEFFGLKEVFRDQEMPPNNRKWLYYGRTAIGICQSDDQYNCEKFQQFRVGLHHICWRMRNKEDIEKFSNFFHKELAPLGGKAIHEPEEGPWAPGYYSFLFEDPDGIRLEVNYVPGQGLLGLRDQKLLSKL